MSTEPPTKRLRASLNGNTPVTECIREFKLPRQYPSMVTKLQNDASIEKIKRQSSTASVISNPKVTNVTKTSQIKDVQSIGKVQTRTIKLRAKDGRDLGEVKLKNSPQNIQGKTITIAKHAVKKKSEVIPVVDKKMGITVGVLTPVNVKIEDLKEILPEEESLVDIPKEKIVAGNLIDYRDVTKLPIKVDSQGRPQVLVFQSGKSWHMIKIPNASSSAETANENTKNRDDDKTQNVSSDYIKVALNIGSNKPNVSAKKSCNATNRCKIEATKCSESAAQESTSDEFDSKSSVGVKTIETTRPKIEISRTAIQSCAKTETNVRIDPFIAEGAKPLARADVLVQKNLRHRQNVAIVLPTDKEKISTEKIVAFDVKADRLKNVDISKNIRSPDCRVTSANVERGTTGRSSTWRRKLSANKNNDAAKYLPNRNLNAISCTEKKEEMKNNLIILEKALSTVEDEVLRAKALKALGEYGTSIERLIPIDPASKLKPVKDSDTQTSIFGLWENEQFVHVAEDLPGVQRISITARDRIESLGKVTSDSNSQDCRKNKIDKSDRQNEESVELTNMVEGHVKGNKAACRVAAILDKPSPMVMNILDKLTADFNDFKLYDEMGLLNIHKSVIANREHSVRRNLLVLRACGESADLQTHDGQTSLELAVRFGASSNIVKILLNAGAEPTSTSNAHDSALIIASKRSDPILMELISFVKRSKLLDNYGSAGFAAVHYCAQNDYREGLTALVRASADINLRDRRSGRTPLFHAIENDHNKLAEMLLEYGADVSAPNYAGQTIFNVMDENKHFNLLQVMNRINK